MATLISALVDSINVIMVHRDIKLAAAYVDAKVNKFTENYGGDVHSNSMQLFTEKLRTLSNYRRSMITGFLQAQLNGTWKSTCDDLTVVVDIESVLSMNVTLKTTDGDKVLILEFSGASEPEAPDHHLEMVLN